MTGENQTVIGGLQPGDTEMTEFEEWVRELREGPKSWYERINWRLLAALAICLTVWVLLLGL